MSLVSGIVLLVVFVLACWWVKNNLVCSDSKGPIVKLGPSHKVDDADKCPYKIESPREE